MLLSMTGFGKGEAAGKPGTVKIEIKSLNYKFFEVISKLPPNLAIFEDRIRGLLQRRVARGRLNLFMVYDTNGKRPDEAHINKDIARQYYNRIIALKRFLGLKGDIGISQIMGLPGVIEYRPGEERVARLWPVIRQALIYAIDDLQKTKAREGLMLKKNVRNIVKEIETSLRRIKSRAPLVTHDYKKRLLKNVKDLAGTRRISNGQRIEEDAAAFARNCDITEETHRIAAHITGFKKVLLKNGEAGRRLDFIAQEMHREVNTIGAKANDFPIAKEVIKIKSHIDKIREQVQNVE
jgi:uncharacterized protein (TIGR00255 family)